MNFVRQTAPPRDVAERGVKVGAVEVVVVEEEGEGGGGSRR